MEPYYEILQFFVYGHLPPALQAVSRPFAELAQQMAGNRGCPETEAGLRKLLEAKDCAVRALVRKQNAERLAQDTRIARVQP